MKFKHAALGFLILSTGAFAEESSPVTNQVMSRDQQSALTQNEIIASLAEGNQRFQSGTLTRRDHSALVRDTIAGQFPQAIILSCVDSRVPVEDIFDQPPGNVLVARVAANIANTDMLGSMEFATRVSGAVEFLD